MDPVTTKALVNNVRPQLLIHQLFESQRARTPDAVAIVFGDQTLTYGQLAKKANQLAQQINFSSPESLIAGVSTHRCIETIVSVLAILKSGKAYLPLDSGYPQDRLQQIVADSGIDICLSTSAEQTLFSALAINVLVTDADYPDAEAQVINKQSACYILYTSGSTGTPKGVQMGHAAMANLLSWQQKHSASAAGFNTLQFAPLTFDVSFQEIFATLTSGGTLILVDDDLRVDPYQLLRYINRHQVNRIFLPFVVLQYLTEAADAEKYFPQCLTEVITAGEQLKITPQLVRFFSALPNCTLFNQYGPTETHVVTQLILNGDPGKWPALPSIGVAVDETEILILDENMAALPYGETGELCVSGTSLADGYLNRPEMTAEKFVNWQQSAGKTTRIYRTGDLAKYLPDGNIEYLGRRDTQVKIRGNRVELGEIEVIINQLPDIQQAIVVAREDIPGQKRLVAYMVSAQNKPDTDFVRKSIEGKLPDYMLPSAYVWLTELPKTSSGKVDRKNLPKPDLARPELGVLYKAATTQLEKNIAAVWTELLLLDKIGLDDNFFLLGGNSLLALKTVAELKHRYQHQVPITKLYQFPTVSGLALLISGANSTHTTPRLKKNNQNAANRDVAIIGMAGRFPGADTLDEFWDILAAGNETISFFSNEELDASIPASLKNDAAYVKARGIINGADEFDAAFFGFNPRSAELMDPQQRLFLELAWETLESAGYLPQVYNGSVGVFAGCGYNTYFTENVLAHPDAIARYGQFNVRALNEKDYIATRTAYQLNLKGPAVAVYAACSTSLLAIAQAVSSIRDGQCDVALAGAASVTSPIKSGHLYEEGSIMSKDGHCRPFDANATGTVFSDGAGAVLLKSFEEARADGDTIYAVIKGIGINNDGADKGSFGGPSALGQAGAIANAIADAGIHPSTISYIEAHGTATPLGDPIELEGLNLAFGTQDAKNYCAVGSVKSNIGHLTAASGVAGLIKTVLAINKKLLPASLHFNKLNPAIDLADSPFYINGCLQAWHSDGLRRAGVSSFGVGGTNVHVVLEEVEQPTVQHVPAKRLSLITWSAKTESSLHNYGAKLAAHLANHPEINLADAAFTLQTTRAGFNHRRFIIAADNHELQIKLNNTASEPGTTKQLQVKPQDIVFMFPGQGSQYLNMGKGLYDAEPVFKAAVDECMTLLQGTPHQNLFETIYPITGSDAAADKLKNTFYTQPAIFIMEYAMAKLWISWGIEPTILVGHSIGEFVAAHFAGVFSLKDALLLITTRATLVSGVAKGSMLSVRMDAAQLQAMLPPHLSLAAVNSNKLSVVAGPDDAIAEFWADLDKLNIPAKLLQTSHAFHSAMMDDIVAPFEAFVKTIKLNAPVKPVMSAVTGKWMSEEEATSSEYWAAHLRSTVQFAPAIDTLQQESGKIFLEVGPGLALATLARQQLADKTTTVLAGFEKNETLTEYFSVLRTLGQLWLNGIEPSWKAFYGQQQALKINLPAYAFDRKRYWLEPKPQVQQQYRTEIKEIIEDKQAPPLHHNLMRQQILADKLTGLFEEASGIEIAANATNVNFIEMGFDSLLLTQIATNLKKEFSVQITFRKLFEEYNTIQTLAAYLDSNLPQGAFQNQPSVNHQHHPAYNNAAVAAPVQQADPALDVIAQQIQQLAGQLAMMQNGSAPAVAVNSYAAPVANNTKQGIQYELTAEEQVEVKKPFGATARIEKQVQGLTEKQQAFLADLTLRYNNKTGKSKTYTQQHRSYMADPRVVSGFRPLTKEVVYPIVVNHSKGSRVWDIDGNEYIDALNGFGSNLLGYQHPVLKQAVLDQVEAGYEIGPQHELAGDVCKLICEFTGLDRAALCNTGSEAVLGAMRIARTVTTRTLIIAFAGSYHGINDEVIVRGTKKLKTIPAAPGIMPEVVQNMLILDYGTDETLRIIKERAHEVAAVLVEPVQSRRPEFQPAEFLKKVREITAEAGAVLIFDEVISGFRMHPRGAQGMFGIKADLCTYGKVIGGGMPIGAIAGIKLYMDALDGGFWQYGDDSQPEAGVTYFAGTFVRHPLALAAGKASLEYMKAKGPALQQGLNSLTAYLAAELNAITEQNGLPLYIPSFGSLWKIKFKDELPYGELLFTLMRDKGIHIWDLFPCFLTESHTKADADAIITAFRSSVDELIAAGFFPSNKQVLTTTKEEFNPFTEAPVPGARLGRDKDGNPGWFISDVNNPGKYLQVKLNGN